MSNESRSKRVVLLAFISAHLFRIFPPSPPSVSSHVNGFTVHSADLYDVRAPFTQHFHYASRVMMQCMNYVDCLNIWLQKEGFHGAEVNATHFNIVFVKWTYSIGLCLCGDCFGFQNGKVMSCNEVKKMEKVDRLFECI